MKRTIAFVAAIAFCTVSSVYALYEVYDHGAWPQSWPKELEPLRKQSRTLVGPDIAQQYFQIPFTKRQEFESAWPHFLKIKSPGAPIILVRGPKTDFFAIKPAGVLIHSPPVGTDKRANPEVPINSTDARERWRNTTFIELVVDGEIVDLNRIQLPADTPIIDERFTDGQNK
ncbi:MAG: hypothetical protein AABP62_02315 [Planctomycetota bacterium]